MSIEVKEVCSPILIKMPDEVIEQILQNQETQEEDKNKEEENKD